MTTIIRDSHLPALEADRRQQAGRELQQTLVELLELSLLGKQLHRTIAGRPFKPLHEHLDELVEWWRDASDTVAERVVVGAAMFSTCVTGCKPRDWQTSCRR